MVFAGIVNCKITYYEDFLYYLSPYSTCASFSMVNYGLVVQRSRFRKKVLNLHSFWSVLIGSHDRVISVLPKPLILVHFSANSITPSPLLHSFTENFKPTHSNLSFSSCIYWLTILQIQKSNLGKDEWQSMSCLH